MWARACAWGLIGLLPLGCGAAVFACEGDAQCVGADGMGTCEPSGYCSFPDETCPSGRRYGDAAPGSIAGVCVPTDEGTGDTGNQSATGKTTTNAEATGEPSGSATTNATMQVLDDSSTTADPHTTSSTSESSVSTGTTDASTTSTRPFTVEYAATIAVCTQEGIHDPEACAAQAGEDQFTVDGQDSAGTIANGWLRFDLDEAIDGADVLSVQLVLRVGPEDFDNSLQSGEVWRVDPFDLDDLSTGNPAAIELLAADVGAVMVDTDVIFDLPTDAVGSGKPLHLGLFPNANNGVDYRSHTSATPPRLVIEAQP